MNRIYNIILATACLALASCTSELEDNKASNDLLRKPMTFVSSIEGAKTKTALVQDGDAFRIQWNADDVIKIFSAEDASGAEFAIDDEMSAEDMMSVTFTGSIAGTAPFAAIYPAYDYATYDATNKTVSFALPQTQEYTYGTFANGANPEVAYVKEGNVLKFKNLCGVLRLSLKGDVTIAGIDLYDNDATANLWGTATVDVESLATTVSNDNTDRHHISIDCDGTIELSDEYATTIHFVLPVGSLANGFSIVLTTPENATFTINTSKSNTIARGVVRSMPELNVTSDKLVLPYIDLDSDEHANCYIISEAGRYRFSAVKGNSNEIIDGIANAEVLWESFGTSTQPSAGDLVKKVSIEDNHICFETTSNKGNALIAVNDLSGNILWSWHIWLTDVPEDQVYNNDAGIVMDRNLGATSTTKGQVTSIGLMYQWGRKDPFLGAATISSTSVASSTVIWPSPVESSSTNGTIGYSIAHPMTFIIRDINNKDWYYTGSETTDNTRWQAIKSLYDPCPKGYSVPSGASNGIWCQGFGTSLDWATESNWDSSNLGMDFSITDKVIGPSTSPIWYPAAGFLSGGDGTLSLVGERGRYWTCTTNSYNAYGLDILANGNIAVSYRDYRGTGRNIRCMKEGTGKDPDAGVPVEKITVSPTTLSIYVGNTSTLSSSIAPLDATVKTITWSSSNTAIATVTSAGVVKGIAAGSATITAKSNNGKSATCTVTVKQKIPTVTAITSTSQLNTSDTYILYNPDQKKVLLAPSSGQYSSIGQYTAGSQLPQNTAVFKYTGGAFQNTSTKKYLSYLSAVLATGGTSTLKDNDCSTSSYNKLTGKYTVDSKLVLCYSRTISGSSGYGDPTSVTYYYYPVYSVSSGTYTINVSKKSSTQYPLYIAKVVY